MLFNFLIRLPNKKKLSTLNPEKYIKEIFFKVLFGFNQKVSLGSFSSNLIFINNRKRKPLSTGDYFFRKIFDFEANLMYY